MKRSSAKHPKRRAEPTIALINIVFLMLIFFLIAGTLAAPLDKDLSLINLNELEGREPPDALLIFSDRRMTFRGRQTSVENHIAFRRDELIDRPDVVSEDTALTIRIVPDRELPARDLMTVANELRTKGATRVIVVMERVQ